MKEKIEKEYRKIVESQHGKSVRDLNCDATNIDVIVSWADLISLDGSPKIVRGKFECKGNELNSLEGGPVEVYGDYLCYNSQLKSLVGSPMIVRGDFQCGGNYLTTLAGVTQHIGGVFNCSNNQLSSLAGGPVTVNLSFDCKHNPLENLIGAPEYIGGNFYCGGVINISLNGITTKEIKGKFVVSGSATGVMELFKIKGITQVNIDNMADVEYIVNRHIGKGIRGMLPCQAELISAGYKDIM